MTVPKYHVCFIGNAIVDIISKITDANLNDLKIVKGSMQLVDENLSNNSYLLGKKFRSSFKSYIANSSIVSKIRGKGLLNAILINDSETGDLAWKICLKLKDNGLLAKPTHGNIIRFAPPLVITSDQLEECTAIILQTLDKFEPKN